MTLRVLLNIEIKPGRAEEFERLWHDHAAYVDGLEANLGQSLSRDTAKPGAYVVLSDWTSEPAFREFEKSEPQQAYLRSLWPIRAGGAMTLLDLV
jgi:heme-degrading monooxygenase HmoA